MASDQHRPRITRRLLGAAALFPALARAAGTSRTVTLAGPGGAFQTVFDPLILGPFRKSHPDIGVFYYPVGNSFQMLNVLRSQRQYPSNDAVLLDLPVAVRARADGLLDTLTAQSMPVIKDLIPQAMAAGQAGPAIVLDSMALGYNPTVVSQAPRTWRNLWDPAYGQRIALQTPPDPLALAMTSVAGKLFGNEGDLLRSLDVGLTALAGLAPRVVLWDPVPDVYNAITYGDANIGPGWNARAQAQAAQFPGRFAAAIPDEGSPVLTTTINLVKGSPQQEAARVLIAWLLGPEAQRLMTELMFFAPVNTKADIPNAALVRVGATPAMVARRMEIDWVAITAVRDQITAEWRRRQIGGR